MWRLIPFFLIFVLLPLAFGAPAGPRSTMARSGKMDKILSLRKQAALYNELLQWRLDNILPRLMREQGLDIGHQLRRNRQVDEAFGGGGRSGEYEWLTVVEVGSNRLRPLQGYVLHLPAYSLSLVLLGVRAQRSGRYFHYERIQVGTRQL